MPITDIAIIMIAACVFAWVSRMCGGGKPELPWGLDQWVYAIPHGVLGFVINPWFIPLTYFGAFLGKRAGHGQWFDMGTSPVNGKTEKLDVIVRLFMGPDDGSFRRDFIGMMVSGIFIVLGSVIALACSGHFLLAVLVAGGGAFKAPAYAIGLKLKALTGIDHNVYGEIITGFMDTICVGMAIWAVFSSVI